MFSCGICGHNGIHAVATTSSLPTRCDECPQCIQAKEPDGA